MITDNQWQQFQLRERKAELHQAKRRPDPRKKKRKDAYSPPGATEGEGGTMIQIR